ncbi:MAG: RNA polymerase sigma factor [Bacteroidetes bacterium]|jgi:RNA polymerase sigma-70 factor (ECF subfamily)|nr:RNA polymerase sigma factor [Bacteroidota bacterium]
MSTTEFNELLVSSSDFLRPFAFTLTRDNEAAKDLLQETLYKALANRDKYNDGTNVKAWMYTIMRNIFINNYRRKSRHKVIFDDSPNEYLLDKMQLAVPNMAESNIRLKEVQSSVHRLPNVFRYPFQMYFDGYKYNEIADMLNEPLGTIKSRIHFARKLLKEQAVKM